LKTVEQSRPAEQCHPSRTPTIQGLSSGRIQRPSRGRNIRPIRSLFRWAPVWHVWIRHLSHVTAYTIRLQMRIRQNNKPGLWIYLACSTMLPRTGS
jgi:hypothetical protein